MAEQFGLNQSFRNGAAANRNKGPTGARAKIVDSPGDEFFASPTFSGNEYGGIEISHTMHKIIDLLHQGAAPNHLIARNGFFNLFVRAVWLSPDEESLISSMK